MPRTLLTGCHSPKLMSQALDILFLKKTLELATIRRGFCAPNPSVGAVIVNQELVLATGYHLGAGFPHAEIEALQKLSNQALGYSLYVTLEPCCHWGLTPPCTEALIAAGIKRVVYGYQDPNPLVSGKGKQFLLAAGIQCDYVEIPDIQMFYASYQHWHATQMPFVTAKIAMSLDGKIAGVLGKPLQITGPLLQKKTHEYRRKSDALLTTIKTITCDDPQLNVRDAKEIISKPLYILDSQLHFSLTANVFNTAKSLTLFHLPQAAKKNKERLLRAGIRCVAIDEDEDGLNLNQVLRFIGKDGVHDLWVEAGARCFTSFWKKKLLQRAMIYIAPKWLGEGISAFSHAFPLEIEQCVWEQVGNDVLGEIRW